MPRKKANPLKGDTVNVFVRMSRAQKAGIIETVCGKHRMELNDFMLRVALKEVERLKKTAPLI